METQWGSLILIIIKKLRMLHIVAWILQSKSWIFIQVKPFL